MARIFHTLAQTCEFCYEEKRSRFIARIWPVETKEAGFAQFALVKKEFPDARHHCWAYLLGDPEQALAAGFNDDGEPGGTAGKPMLNVLTQRKVGNVFAVVVRYFGGVKLGAGGLTRAYGQAVSGALDLAVLRAVVPMGVLTITTEFALEQRVRNILGQFSLRIDRVDYAQQVVLRCNCPLDQLAEVQKTLTEQTSGKILCSHADADE